MGEINLSARQCQMIEELVPLYRFSKKMQAEIDKHYGKTVMQIESMTVAEKARDSEKLTMSYAKWKGAQTDFYYLLEKFVREMLPDFMVALYIEAELKPNELLKKEMPKVSEQPASLTTN